MLQTYDEWIWIFDKAKMLKSELVLVGVKGKLVGFDPSLSILRVIDIPTYYELPTFSFMVKDLGSIYDAKSLGASEVMIGRTELSVKTETVNEWITSNSGDMIPIYPSISINTNPYQLMELYNRYQSVMTATNRPPSENLGSLKGSDILNQYNELKADSGNIIFRNGRHTLIMFYGWFKNAKADDVHMSFYDIPDSNTFVTRVDIIKPKNAGTITTYTVNFAIV